jgi:hypothetical protein
LHSHLLKCRDKVNTGVCTVMEYGDTADIMGTGDTAHFNAFQKDRLGWLNHNVSPPIINVTQSGTYNISPYETIDSLPKALKIAKTNSVNKGIEYYYLEFRQGIGFDEHLGKCTNCDFTNGILLHQGNVDESASSNLLDMTPGDDSSKLVTLLPGQSFMDPDAANGGATITVNSVSSSGASITVALGEPPNCVRAKPTMTINPATTQWVSPGGSAIYSLVLKNNDQNCLPSTFKLVSQLSYPNITRHLNQNPIVLPSQGTANAEFFVGSNVETLLQEYQLNVKGVDANDATRYVYVSAFFGVQA